MHYWLTFGNAVFMFYASLMPYWNFDYTEAVTLHCGKVGSGIGQDPATEVTHFGLNQSPIFFCCVGCGLNQPPVSAVLDALLNSRSTHDNEL